MSHLHCSFDDVTCTSDERLRRLIERLVRHSTYAPSSAPSTRSIAPTSAPSSIDDANADDDGGGGGLGWFGTAILLLIGAAVLWGLWERYQRQVEQRMLDFRSKQADRVLGDMQMVPNEDLDNELL